MNIFLDIDGVLCPPSTVVRDGSAYCHVTRFETIMREFPEWKIVISSGLRERLDLNQLRSRFSDDIAARIVGVTPVIGMSIPQCRQHEIERYLHNADQALFPWIALDDMADQFVSGLSNLVLCDMDKLDTSPLVWWRIAINHGLKIFGIRAVTIRSSRCVLASCGLQRSIMPL